MAVTGEVMRVCVYMENKEFHADNHDLTPNLHGISNCIVYNSIILLL